MAENKNEDVPEVNKSVNPADNTDKEPAVENKTGITLDEVNKLVEKARAEEKQKLYSRLETSQSELEKLKASNAEYIKKVEDAQKEKLSESEKLTALITDLKSQFEASEKARQDERIKLEQENRQIKLDSYKREKILDAKGAIIEELVTGSSEAEIDASILTAKQKYKSIFDAATKASAKDSKGETTAPVPTPANPVAPATINDLSAEQIASLSPQEWAKVRESVLKNLSSS